MSGLDGSRTTWADCLVAVAAALATAVLGLEVAARAVAVSAVPAALAFGLLVLQAAVLAAALVAGRAHRPSWRVVGAAATTVALVVARVALSPVERTPRWLAPLLVVPAVLAWWELAARARTGARPDRGTWERIAVAWSVTAAGGVLALVLGPARWGTLDVRAVGIRPLGTTVAALSLAAAVAAGRRPALAARFVAVAAAASVVAAAAPGVGEPVPVVVPLAAAAIPAVLVTLVPAVERWATRAAAAVRRRAHGGLRGVRARLSARRLRALVGAPRRAWRATLERSAPPAPSPRPHLSTVDRAGGAVMALASLGLVLPAAWWAHRAGWQPTGHAATLLARANDVGTSETPLVGLVTSLGGGGSAAHPGPLLADVLAPFVRVLGLQDGALVAGVLGALGFWWVSVWAAWRAGGRLAALGAWVLGALVLEVAAMGAVWEANNVSVTLLAIFATAMASWAAATGTWRAWWWAVGLGTLCTQSYAPHALVVIGPVLWSGMALAGARRTAVDPAVAARVRGALRGGFVIGAVLWLQPVLDVVVNRGGNLRGLWQQASQSSATLGAGGFLRAVTWALQFPPRWGSVTDSFARADRAADLLGGALVVGALVAVGVGVLWWRTRHRVGPDERQLRFVAVLVLVGAGLNATQLPAEALRTFQLGWLVVASMTAWYAIALSVLRAVRARVTAPQQLRWAPATRAATLGVGCAVMLGAGLASPRSIEDIKGRPYAIDAMVDPLTDRTLAAARDEGPLLVYALDTVFNEAVTDTLMANLLTRGLDVRVEPGSLGLNYGSGRLAQGRWSGPELWVVNGTAPVHPPGRRVAAASVPGWSAAAFDRVADDVARSVGDAPTIELQPGAEEDLVRYLAGWPVQDRCGLAGRARDGRLPVAAIPRGLLLTLYGEGVVARPTLPPALQAEAMAVVGQAPVEVWLVPPDGVRRVGSADLLRDGTRCGRVRRP